MKVLIIGILVFLAGMYWAWYWDNKAIQKYKNEIKELKAKLRRWGVTK